MTKQEAIEKAGSQAELARILGVSRGAVFHWKHIPLLRIYQLKEKKPEWFGL
jgi:biotin operon repressor